MALERRKQLVGHFAFGRAAGSDPKAVARNLRPQALAAALLPSLIDRRGPLESRRRNAMTRSPGRRR